MSNENFLNLPGIEHPIIQAPMAGVQDSALTIAVCEAGGLGSLPCAMLNVDKIVNEIKVIKEATDKPFNLNFFCHKPSVYNPKQHKEWQSILKPYFQELKLEADSIPEGANRTPFNHDVADAIEPFHPDIISFHFGLPERELLKRVKGWGTQIISSATTLEEALWLESQGADCIVAQGLEAGGHRGMFLSNDVTTQVGLFSLLPQIVRSVSVPVVAAGGIGDSNSVRAALALGASAAQIGTAYLLCTEATTSRLHRSALKSAKSRHTALTNIFSGKPARGIVNRVMRDLGYIHSSTPDFPNASIEMTPLRATAEQDGSDDFSPLWSGQNTSGCLEISATELTKLLAS